MHASRMFPKVLLVLASLPCHAQVGEKVRLGDNCSYFGESLPAAVTTFSSNQEAEDVIRNIVKASGLAQNFQVRAAGVPNAAAVIQGTTRYILYNTAFIRNVRDSTGSDWAPRSIMAHEIGHHLNGHTLDHRGSRPDIELEADYFSGFILQKLGASLGEAQAAMQRLGSPTGSETHPARHDRLEAIASGWSGSCDTDPACRAGGMARQPSRREPEPDAEPRPLPGPDSCDFARDGTCDEPDVCDRGTDTSDCSRPRKQSGPDIATACVTSMGACPMGMPVARGSYCVCFTPMGNLPGTAQ